MNNKDDYLKFSFSDWLGLLKPKKKTPLQIEQELTIREIEQQFDEMLKELGYEDK